MGAARSTGAFDAFVAYRLRMCLAIAGSALSTFCLITIADVLQGVQVTTLNALETLGSRTVFVAPTTQSIARERPIVPLTFDDIDAIKRHVPNVSDVSPQLSLNGFVRGCGRRRMVTIIGVTSADQWLQGRSVTAGRFVATMDLDHDSPVAVLGEAAAAGLGCSEFVGRFVSVSGFPTKVVGVLASKGQTVRADLDNVVLIPMSVAIKRYAGDVSRSLSAIVVATADKDVPAVIEGLRRQLRSRHSLRVSDPDDFDIRSESQLVGEATTVFATISMSTIVLLSVGLVVAAIGVLNAVMTGVIERTAEIGLRRCVGATRRNIRLQFVGEALLISVLGSVAGTLASIAVGAGLWFLFRLPFAVSVQAVVFAGSSAIVLGLCAGVWPAMRASAMEPIDALRYE